MDDININGNLFEDFLDFVFINRLKNRQEDLNRIMLKILADNPEGMKEQELIEKTMEEARRQFYPGGLYDET